MTEDKIKQKISGSDGKLDTIEVTHTYKYSNWYGSTKKYPKTAKVYRDSDGKCFERIEMKYKKIWRWEDDEENIAEDSVFEKLTR